MILCFLTFEPLFFLFHQLQAVFLLITSLEIKQEAMPKVDLSLKSLWLNNVDSEFDIYIPTSEHSLIS